MFDGATIIVAAAQKGSGSTLLFVVLAVLVGAWLISLLVHPWRHCRECNSSPRTYGGIFQRSFRICTRCGGTGRQKRFMANFWSKNRDL